MLEVIPANLARGVQLAGLRGTFGRGVPTRALIAFWTPDSHESSGVRGVWLAAQRDDGLPEGAIRDLLLDVLPSYRAGPNGPVSQCCPVCGGASPGWAATADGRPVCPTHLAELWERLAQRWFRAAQVVSCPRCGRSASFLWSQGGGIFCSRCLVSSLSTDESTSHWILTAFSPLPSEMQGELRIFREAWRWVSVCLRCGSSEIRIRRILLDFPKVSGPVYPLWEMDKKDRTPGAELRRWRQLQIYTQGFMRVTLECPQCGYLERELPGVGSGPVE